MTVPYHVIEIFTSEEARSEGKPIADAVIDLLRHVRIAARCFVSRGQAGYYENGEVASARLEVLSSNLPLKIEVILPAPEVERVLPQIIEIVTDGILVVEETRVVSHRSRYRLIPRQLLVRDIMATPAVSVGRNTPVSEVVNILLREEFNALPVVDDAGKPVGIVTQGDLIRRADMPVRLGLLSQLDHSMVSDFRERAAQLPAGDVMTSPLRTIRSNEAVSRAVEVMRKHELKRLPVTGEDGRLTGMITRLDIFRTAVSHPPLEAGGPEPVYVDWNGVPRVRDCMRSEMGAVTPETSLDEVLRTLDERSVQRLAVVDAENRLLGLVTDKDILAALDPQPEGTMRAIIARLPIPGLPRRPTERISLSTTAGEIMKTDLITIGEDANLEGALRLMLQHSLKRLPVLDPEGHYKGMISRNDLLRLSART